MKTLPNRWFITIYPPNIEIVRKWCFCPRIDLTLSKYNMVAYNGEIMLDRTVESLEKVGMNEISTNDFIKLVLKEEVFPEKWKIKITTENADELDKFYSRYIKGYKGIITRSIGEFVASHNRVDNKSLFLLNPRDGFLTYSGSSTYNFPEITFEQFKQKYLTTSAMKTVTRKQLSEIWELVKSCNKWSYRIEGILKTNQFGDTFEISDSMIEEAYNEYTSPLQLEWLNKYFPKPKKKTVTKNIYTVFNKYGELIFSNTIEPSAYITSLSAYTVKHEVKFEVES